MVSELPPSKAISQALSVVIILVIVAAAPGGYEFASVDQRATANTTVYFASLIILSGLFLIAV